MNDAMYRLCVITNAVNAAEELINIYTEEWKKAMNDYMRTKVMGFELNPDYLMIGQENTAMNRVMTIEDDIQTIKSTLSECITSNDMDKLEIVIDEMTEVVESYQNELY